jgi:hypothetical protein
MRAVKVQQAQEDHLNGQLVQLKMMTAIEMMVQRMKMSLMKWL